MDYKVALSDDVDKKIIKINDYWINELSNTNFNKMFYDEYMYVKSLLIINPRMYNSYGEYYKIPLKQINYNLYYKIIDDLILIVDIKSFKENQ